MVLTSVVDGVLPYGALFADFRGKLRGELGDIGVFGGVYNVSIPCCKDYISSEWTCSPNVHHRSCVIVISVPRSFVSNQLSVRF